MGFGFTRRPTCKGRPRVTQWVGTVNARRRPENPKVLVILEHDGQRVGTLFSPLPKPGDLVRRTEEDVRPRLRQQYRVLSVVPGSLWERRAAVARVEPLETPE